jgi:hypothetical protein
LSTWKESESRSECDRQWNEIEIPIERVCVRDERERQKEREGEEGRGREGEGGQGSGGGIRVKEGWRGWVWGGVAGVKE